MQPAYSEVTKLKSVATEKEAKIDDLEAENAGLEAKAAAMRQAVTDYFQEIDRRCCDLCARRARDALEAAAR